MKIAIIERIENYDEEKPFSKRYYLDDWYVQIFNDLDVLLIPVVSQKNIEQVVNMCDGLIVTGSFNDVHPKYYGEKPIDGKDYVYDEFNLVKDLVKGFEKANKPIFGICAGIQEINVIYGGTLYQQIPNHRMIDGSKHIVKLSEESFLHNVYDKKEILVNSYHNQAIKDLAKGFKVSAISEDGIIEAIEKGNVVAVQWHPEIIKDMKLFKDVVEKLFKIRK